MEIKIGNNKYKKILFDYLNSIDIFTELNGYKNYHNENVKDYYYTYVDDDIVQDNEYLFSYYENSDDYEDISGVISPYDSSTYPLIEMVVYHYDKIISLFGEKYAPQLMLEWLNNRYDLQAKSIAAN